MNIKLLTVTGLICGGCLSVLGQGQVTLSAGDAFTSEFDTLGSLGRFEDFPFQPHGRIDVFHTGFESGDSILIEMFEDTTEETPILSSGVTWTEGSGIPPPPASVFFWSIDAWQDLQGVVRVTGISGSVNIWKINVSAARDEDDGLMWYGSSIPVPEPTASSLIIYAAGALVFTRIKGTKGF